MTGSLPVVDLGPNRLNVVVLVNNEILVEGGSRRTGVIGQDSQARANGKILRTDRRAVSAADNTVLLVG